MSETVDVAIITVLKEEYNAVRDLLVDQRFWAGSAKMPNSHAWVVGRVEAPGLGSYRVVLGMPSKAGQEYIQPVIHSTLQTFSPSFVFLCGIAAGLHRNGVKNGDVMISEMIWGYEYGKIVSNEFVPRHDNSIRADEALLLTSLWDRLHLFWCYRGKP